MIEAALYGTVVGAWAWVLWRTTPASDKLTWVSALWLVALAGLVVFGPVGMRTIRECAPLLTMLKQWSTGMVISLGVGSACIRVAPTAYRCIDYYLDAVESGVRPQWTYNRWITLLVAVAVGVGLAVGLVMLSRPDCTVKPDRTAQIREVLERTDPALLPAFDQLAHDADPLAW